MYWYGGVFRLVCEMYVCVSEVLVQGLGRSTFSSEYGNFKVSWKSESTICTHKVLYHKDETRRGPETINESISSMVLQ